MENKPEMIFNQDWENEKDKMYNEMVAEVLEEKRNLIDSYYKDWQGSIINDRTG